MDKTRLTCGANEETVPIPVQLFLWRQLRPFIRPKLGKLHEASCPSIERVLLQNIHNELTPSLRDILGSVPRWRLIQTALPYVLHAASNLLHNRKDFQSLNAMETTFLYIVHWFLLDAAEECAENECEAANPFYYVFPISTMSLFVYLFAPLCNHLKDIDFKSNLRLENGMKIWPALYDCRHPDATCFTTPCRPKPRALWNRSFKTAKQQRQQPQNDNIFTGENPETSPSQTVGFSEQSIEFPKRLSDDENAWVSSPKDKAFPETIPEESSSAEDEHVVIRFRLPSFSESDRMIDGVKEVSTIFAGEASIFHVAMGRTTSSSASTLTIEQVTAMTGTETNGQKFLAFGEYTEDNYFKSEKDSSLKSKLSGFNQQRDSPNENVRKLSSISVINADVRTATFLDVAVLRCLFVSQWQEEGVFWALQFLYHRIRRINEEVPSTQYMPRRRSNSLPIPKIEVSIFHTSDGRKHDESRDLQETRDTGMNLAEADSSHHTRRASEKTKKRMKMADLKAFVETKLLSKSEKALEKIGQEEPKMVNDQECHRSLDAGEDRLTRQNSTSSKIFDARDVDSMLHPSNLIKGKSMPSLRYIGDMRMERKQSSFYSQSYAVPNPIITVTEHTPTPSPDYLKRHASIDSQLDQMNMQDRLFHERKPSLARSKTDSNITYSSDELPEAPGSSDYITKEGDIDYLVVLKALHAVAIRDKTCCTLRVCENILNLAELLIDMGVLRQFYQSDELIATSPGFNGNRSNVSKNRHGSSIQFTARTMNGDNKQFDCISPQDLLMNCAIRVLRHLGCPHGCADGIRGQHADFCRSQAQMILSKLQKSSSKQFTRFLKTMMRDQEIPDVLDFFHAFVGFCVDPGSLLSPLNQKRGSSKSPDTLPQNSYATNFGSNMAGATNCASGSPSNVNATGTGVSYATGFHVLREIEGHIVNCVFKVLVTRFVETTEDLKFQDNIPLYCELRQFMNYVKETHGGVFRRVALSGILDSSDRPNKRCKSQIQTTRVIRHIHLGDMEEKTEVGDSGFVGDERGTRKSLFKKRSTSSTCASVLETEASEENAKVSQSPLANIRKKPMHVLTPRQSEKNLDIGEPSHRSRKSRSTKIQIGGIVSWFRKDNSKELTNSHESSESPTESSFVKQPSFHRGLRRGTTRSHVRGVSRTFERAKRRMEDHLNKIGLRKGKKKESFEEVSGTYLSRRNSFEAGDAFRESEFVVLKERKMIPKMAIHDGMLRFSFLLDICQPGSVPDHHLMGALLDLPHAPIVARACMFLECAHFVHRCNKGQWPDWMKFPQSRQSLLMHGRANITNTISRRMQVLQRAAGKMFYQWAEAIGTRLEEFLIEDKKNLEHIKSTVSDDTKQKELNIEDEEEDFLDEASINAYGSHCPVALRMVACVLLFEITAFLRETYQTMPKASKLFVKERVPLCGEKMYSREPNRRWSMALSNMGHSQSSAQSLQSIAGDRDGERKINFVLHEPDNESEGSSKSNVTIQGEDVQNEKEKKRIQAPQSRPFLLRRGTTMGNTGSFKRRSLKLRRNTKEGKDLECDMYTVKRTDSIQSRRKVSTLSDRSDTSEPGYYGEVSGEESPGILSDDQPPESPSDSNDTDETNKNFPWMKVLVQMTGSFNFYCCHQNFCHPFCHRRQIRAGGRLIRSVRKIYGEKFGLLDGNIFEGDLEKKNGAKKDSKRGRKVSDQTSTQVSPVRRKDSVGRKFKIEKSLDGSQSGRLTGSGNRDSFKDLADQDSEWGRESKTMGNMEDAENKAEEPSAILKYIQTQAKDVFHAPLATLVKGAVVVPDELFMEVLSVAWELLLESNQEVAASAASLFIIGAVRAPQKASDIMNSGLMNVNVSIRINAILRFQVLWKLRYQVWPRMEESAHSTFKVPPPGIEFTLPSPKIGIESLPVVDPPWMPEVKTNVEEVTLNQERHRSLVTATKTRKKQQTESIKKHLQEQKDKKTKERESFLITTIPITVQAAYEPRPAGDDHEEDEDGGDMVTRNTSHHGQSALSLFPSSLCSAIIQIINLLDDAAVSDDGSAVYQVAYEVIWNCLVEDSALFLRYVLERLTREKQELMFKILRHLIRFVPKLPQQAAFALYNYIIGYIMFYVRSPHEGGQKYIGIALSVLWMVVHSVHGIMFKDLKQILRKEQCDASILLTANVPSAKKIIVHGPQDPDAGGIPSQFPVQEDTQFCQILKESFDFFGIDELKQREYFLVDYKTHQIHNPSSYVRDFYFFKRSQYPQLELVHMKPEEAYDALQRQELNHKFVEIGKVMLTWAILKNVDMVVQRVVFLHEELMKLPSFPRKALSADLDLYKGGEIGKELFGLDVMHKFMWVRLIARMFEAMANNFAYSGDIHLFLNVLNGALILHSEDSCILRYVVATYINAAHNFKNIFSINGYLLIMPSLMQLYSTHQTNKLVKTTVEYAVKQFYLMNRKPFILQMFGSVSWILDTDEASLVGDAHKVPAGCLFELLLSLETPSPDPLNIGELVKEEKPLKAIDFCYHDENEMVTVLDCISLCVMVIAYAADSIRGQQMLIILEAILPCYVQQIQAPTYYREGKTEKEIINQLAVAMRTLINNCEALTKYYNRQQKSSPEHKGSSQKNYGKGPYSPGYEYDDDAHHRYAEHSKMPNRNMYDRDNDDTETYHKNEFRRPRDTLLNMIGDFVNRSSARLSELNKKSPDGKTIEILDSKCHVRLSDIAHSLLKIAPYDPGTMACRGLKRYMIDILPATDWSSDDMRPAFLNILRRIEKTFGKIYKKPSIRRNTDWDAASDLLKGIYETLLKRPYIAHFQYLKTLLTTCQALIVGDTAQIEVTSNATAALMSKIPPQRFSSTVLRLISLHVISLGDGYSLENVCGSTMYANAGKAENLLLHLLIPLVLRVSSGKKDVPKLQQADINFTLTAVLNTLWPSSTRPMPVTLQNLKIAADMRAGSLTFANRDSKSLTKVSLSLYQVAFLALKIIIICFESDLTSEWSRILRTMRLLNKRNEASLYLWNFLEFVVTHRTPLYIQMMPFIVMKIGNAPISEHERNMQTIIREIIHGEGTAVPKSRGALLIDLQHELKDLKEEIEKRRFDEMQPEPKRSVAEVHPTIDNHGRTQRPSLLIDLLTGDLGSKTHINRTPTDPPTTALSSQPHSSHQSISSNNTSRTTQHSQVSTVTVLSNNKREPLSNTSVESSLIREGSEVGPGESQIDLTQPTDRSSQPSSTSDERMHNTSHPKLKMTKLRFVSSVEYRHSSGETVTSQLSPSSPNDDSSSEIRPDKPRLQRSMGQSKRTFRLRKSRKAQSEQVVKTDIELQPTPPTLLEPLLQEPSPSPPRSVLRASSRHTTPTQPEPEIPNNGNNTESAIDDNRNSLSEHFLLTEPPQNQHSRPNSDVSCDESTSGYKESCSIQLTSLGSTGSGSNSSSSSSVCPGPTLASPDIHDIFSDSSTATATTPATTTTTSANHVVFGGSSPDCSINDGNLGDKNGQGGRGPGPFRGDEDTLI